MTSRRHRLGANDMAGQDLDQLVLVLGLEQRVDRAGRQRVEGLVGRREDGERAGALQRLDQAGGLDGRDQRGVILRVDGVLDDVLVGIHGGAADHRVFGIGSGGECGNSDGAGEQKGGEFAHDVKLLGLSFPLWGREGDTELEMREFQRCQENICIFVCQRTAIFVQLRFAGAASFRKAHREEIDLRHSDAGCWRREPCQMLFRSPAATTGPVGWPVGEPPAGSRLTASTAPCASFSLHGRRQVRCVVAPTGMTPIDTGAFLPSIIHSSKSWPAARSPDT